jgi:ribosomal protein S27AE
MEWSRETDVRWQQLTEEVLSGIKGWRLAHPKATLTEMEVALDERWARARVRMLQDMAMASAAAQGATEQRPMCSRCGQQMTLRGQDTRTLTTCHDQSIRLTRSYAVCPSCDEGVFPPR